MNKQSKKTTIALAFAVGCLAGSPALADDIELFVGSNASIVDSEPNVLFIIDTSGSMNAIVGTPPQYDPTVLYEGGCVANRIYWKESDGRAEADACGVGSPDAANWFEPEALKCDAAQNLIGQIGFTGLDFFARFDSLSGLGEWLPLAGTDGVRSQPVECANDSGVHGDGVDQTRLYAADGVNGPWSDSVASEVTWGSGVNTSSRYVLYSGNYLNWRASPESVPDTRISVVQDVANELLDSSSNINVGLMRFSNNQLPDDAAAEGGMVVFDIEAISSAREPLKEVINGLVANGFTPLAETLFEAGQYFHGREVVYGLDSVDGNGNPQPSVSGARSGPNLELYDSPAAGGVCRKNFVILLSDGAPTRDLGADPRITGLPGFAEATGATDCDGTGDGRCLDDMAAYLLNADLDGDAGNGLQSVSTYTIGFAVDLPLLESTAQRGGGEYYTVDDVSGLQEAFQEILRDIREENTIFAAPAVAVNAFNRTQSLSDLYFAVFQADSTPHWDGNLKKYKFLGNQIVGVNVNAPAVDPNTGFFNEGARSFWSQTPDGGNVTRGGAANRLPGPIERNLYTFTGSSSDLTAESNQVVASNATLTDAMLGIGGPGDPDRDSLIDWARGADVLDDDADGDTGEARRIMGDPLHSAPAVVVYGGLPGSPDNEDALVFVGTNDGYLHAIDVASGEEVFAFIPRELLANLAVLFENADSPNKTYGLDGPIQVLRKDINADGVIDAGAGDRVILYVGMRRGGTNYYALDVSRPDRPALIWQVGRSELPRLGQTWSTPIISRVAIDGASQNAENSVLIIGGGYAANQDNPGYSSDSFGNAIYILDAESGELLWSAGPDDANDLVLADMTNAIPSTVRVIDLNNDQFADRMYVGDMGGRVWRFDIFNGQAADSLVTGGVLASLGAADLESPSVADNRRFYNAPDVALVPRESDSYLNIAIGSGYRAHPLNTETQDRFYGLRDYNVFAQLSQTDYDAISANPIRDGDPQLVDVTSDPTPIIPAGALGWKLLLPGEKVLSESRTFNGTVIFTTFSPSTSPSACVPGRGSNKLYQVNILDASPVTNLDGMGGSETLTVQDRARQLAQTGIAPTPTFLFPSPDSTDGGAPCEGENCSCVGDDCGIPRPRCLVGLEACDVDFGNPPIRTFWTQRDIDPN